MSDSFRNCENYLVFMQISGHAKRENHLPIQSLVVHRILVKIVDILSVLAHD
jgi:hypothetical protein